MAELGSGQPTAAYGRYVDQGVDEETESYYAKNHWPAVRGSKKFAEAHLQSNAGGREIRRDRQIVSAKDILRVVAQHMSCDKNELLKAKRRKGADNTGRLIVMKLCQEQGSMKLSEVAQSFGVGSDSAISRAISRFSAELIEDGEKSDIYKCINQDLTP